MLEPKKGLQTTTIHAGEDENPSKGLSSPIYQSATYRFVIQAASLKQWRLRRIPSFMVDMARPTQNRLKQR